MQRRTSLFILSKDTRDETITAAAEAAAEQEAHLACLLLEALPGPPSFAFGHSGYAALVASDGPLERLRQNKAAAKKRVDDIETLLARSNCPGDVQFAVWSGNDIGLVAARRALTCDIAQIADDLTDPDPVFREATYGILFQSPVPLMLNGSPFAHRDRIFLAWDSSLSAARAAHAALPYLRKASEVIIGCIDSDLSHGRDGEDPGTDIAAWLSHHGCAVTLSQFASNGQEIGTSIQSRAREIGVDLVVMGAYGHSRMRQAMFGGTTRTMLQQTELPIFLAH
ncbi:MULTISPECIES: universal stress protein [unclassified Phaeobacter]|uniref:universal stress protein n=1 Tax=unclassified Phaeobacter TaxID=2621772 RepID=UPI003A87C7A2